MEQDACAATQFAPAGLGDPPGPARERGPLSLRRLLAAALRDPHRLWTREHFESRAVRVTTPFGDWLALHDPAAARHVLVDAAERYGRDAVQRHVLARTTGRGLFCAEGDVWRRQRRTLAPFFTPRAVAQGHAVHRAQAQACAERLQARGEAELGGEMAALAIAALARTLLDGRLDEAPHAVALSVRRFAAGVGRVGVADLLDLPDWLPRVAAWRVRGEAANVRARAKRICAAATAGPVAAMRQARDAHGAPALTPREIEDNVSTLIGAGSDTTALALAWAIWLASRDAAVAARLDAETAGLDGAPPAAFADAPWTRAVVEEAMRLYPPAPAIGRLALDDDRVGDLAIARGTAVVIAPWVLHRHRLLWEAPDAFRPERFLPGRREAIDRFAYLPFGAGPRVCLGQHYALQSATVAMATLWRRLRFTPAGEGPGGLFHAITLQPVNGLRVRVSPRGPGA